jgi:hypothetical protein
MGFRYEEVGWVRGMGISGVRYRRASGATLEGRKDERYGSERATYEVQFQGRQSSLQR